MNIAKSQRECFTQASATLCWGLPSPAGHEKWIRGIQSPAPAISQVNEILQNAIFDHSKRRPNSSQKLTRAP